MEITDMNYSNTICAWNTLWINPILPTCRESYC